METQEKVGILVSVGAIGALGIVLLCIFWPSNSELRQAESPGQSAVIHDSKGATPQPPAVPASPGDKGSSHVTPPRSPTSQRPLPPTPPSPPPPTQTHMSLADHDQRMKSLKREFAFVPISDWKGLKFIFLERPKSSQKYGYQSFKGGKGEYGHPTYAEAVGRTGTVIEVVARDPLWDVTVKMDDNGQVYIATAYLESISSITPVAEIEKARALWKGKTLWPTRDLVTYYAETEKFATVKSPKYGPAKVIDILPAWYEHKPVQFILETASGERGFLDCQLSGTNCGNILRRKFEFADCFFIEDPRKLFTWDERTWSAIENGKVFIGMTREQGRLSWGEPKEVNRTTTAQGTREQWVYSSGNYLYFENGSLTAIQD